MRAWCLLVLVACSGSSAPFEDAGVVEGGADARTVDLATALAERGLTAQRGSFEFLDLSGCCQVTCSGNNPTTPYAAFFVPRGPGQTAPNTNERPDMTASSFRLRSDEALLLLGPTPPEAAYFGFTPYLMDRAQPNRRVPIFASLSETLNSRLIGGAQMAIIASADAKTTSAVKDALAAAGSPAESVSTLVFDPAVSRFGLEEGADTFGVLFRLALVKDPAKRNAFIANPGAQVFRLTPQTTSSTPAPSPTARPKSGDASELALKSAVDALGQAIVARYPNHTANPVFVSEGVSDPYACIQQGTFCAGDNRDTNYPSTLARNLFPSDDDFYVVYGVDHRATNKTVYSNVSVYALERLVGLKSATSEDFAGSAQALLPSPDAPKLYAYKIARACSGEKYCLEIPKGTCPTGIENGELGTLTFRTYLEPATNTAPAPSTLLRDRVLFFKKK